MKYKHKKPHKLLFGDIINIKDSRPNNIKIDEKHTKLFLFTIWHMRRSKIQIRKN